MAAVSLADRVDDEKTNITCHGSKFLHQRDT